MSSVVNINGETRDTSSLTLPQDCDFRAAWQFNGDVVEIDVAKAKPIARSKVNEYRDKQKHKPFTVDGLGDFSADEVSKSNIDGAAQAALIAKIGSAPFSVDWTLHDNTPITLDADQMQAVGLALMAHVNAAYTSARIKKAEIEAANTMVEIEAVLNSLS